MSEIKTESNHLDFVSLLNTLKEKRSFILIFASAFLTIGLLFGILKPKAYQANLLLQIHQQQASLPSLSKEPRNQLENKHESIASQIALIRSRFILGPVIQQLGLDLTIKKPKKADELIIKEFNLPIKYHNKKLSLAPYHANQFQLFDNKNKLLLTGTVGEISTDNNISIKVTKLKSDPNAKFILVKEREADTIEKLLKQLTIIDLSHNNDDGTNKIGTLQLTLNGKHPHLITDTLNKIALVMQEKNMERKSRHLQKTLSFLLQELPNAEQALQEAETKLNVYRANTGKDDIKLQYHKLMSQITDLDKELQELQIKRDNMLEQYTSSYPFADSLTAKINKLQSARKAIYVRLKKLPASDQTVTILNRDINVKNSLYLALLQQIHELKVAEASMMSDVQILLFANAPHLLKVRISLIAAMSFIIGIILGCIIVLGMRMVRQERA